MVDWLKTNDVHYNKKLDCCKENNKKAFLMTEASRINGRSKYGNSGRSTSMEILNTLKVLEHLYSRSNPSEIVHEVRNQTLKRC